MDVDCDILVSGGGIAGLTAAAAFGQLGYRVFCVDPAPPVIRQTEAGADLRTTAILQPGRQTLEAVSLWDRLAPYATPLETMRIIDAADPDPQMHVSKDFRARDISEAPFGWNLPNWLLKRELLAQIEGFENVTFRAGVATTGFFSRTYLATARLSDGTVCKTRLIVAADGRNSPLRKAAGISVHRRRYGQKALAFAVTHAIPHQNVSTELHASGGPFTLVPLPDHDGSPSSAVVWMDDGPEQVRRHAMPIADFEATISDRSQNALGPLTLVSPRTLWPIISQQARRLTAQRLVLIAEAAHVLPPIGAQGLNLSLKDIAALVDIIAGAEDPGTPEILKTYETRRLPDIRLRLGGIDLLNRASQTKSPLLQKARAQALNALYTIKPLRTNLMQLGLGTH